MLQLERWEIVEGRQALRTPTLSVLILVVFIQNGAGHF
jgi:hypothetical protein